MNLPASFIDYTRSLLGDEEFEKLASALRQEPPVSIRLNNRKWRMDDRMFSAVRQSGVACPRLSVGSCLSNRVPWASEGYYLNERLTFTFDPLFHAGCYYVQEASSMFIEQVFRRYVTKPVIMLDLCAAPGGKSTHARNLLPDGSLLVANEVVRNRLQVLVENLTKWGYPDVIVTNNEPSGFSALSSFFDVVLLDVPCSGEGMFRKDSTAIEEWSVENVEICWQRQRRIVADVWTSLKPGGILVYSTCTYNTKEDEENVRWIQQEYGADLLAVDVCDEWNITGNLLSERLGPVYHFFPHKTRGEGFFLAAFRKPAEEDGELEDAACFFPKNRFSKKKNKREEALPFLKENIATAKSWLNETVAGKYALSVTEGAEIYAFPQQYIDELAILKQNLKVIMAGTAIGKVKGKDLVPSHALAMSTSLLKQDAFAVEEVNYEQAVAYLRKEAVTLSVTAPRGYVLLTYQHIPLGFVKNIGNRANNLYPQDWRIRSGYLPEEIRILSNLITEVCRQASPDR